MNHKLFLLLFLGVFIQACRQEQRDITDSPYTYRITDLKDMTLQEASSGQTLKIFSNLFDFSGERTVPGEAGVYFDRQWSPILRYGPGYIITKVPVMNRSNIEAIQIIVKIPPIELSH